MSINPRINITTINSIDTKTACFNRARYYDPSLERFLGEDPLRFNAGDINFYRYVGNSPVNFVDPSGEWAILLGLVIDIYFASPWVEDKLYARALDEECEKIISELEVDCDECTSSTECEEKMATEILQIRNQCFLLLTKHLEDTIRNGG